MNTNPVDSVTGKNKKVMMLATSVSTQGGITAVIKVYQQLPFWQQYHIKWLETHCDGGLWKKLCYALRSFGRFLFTAPSYDLIHIHLSEIPSMLRKLPFFLCARLYGCKVVLHFHFGAPETTINSRLKFLYRYMFAKADRVIVLSLSLKNLINDYLHLSDNIVVIYNPCPIVDKTAIVTARKNRILYAGMLALRKGYADLLQAFSSIANHYPDWTLIVAGTGDIEKVKQQAAELNIAHRVRFVGWVGGQQKADLFSETSIFCLPSHTEGLPMALLDAFAYGIPVVATPVGGIPDIIRNQENGLLFPAGDVSALSRQLSLLMDNPPLRQHLSQQSCLMAKTLFNPEAIEKQLCTLYESLIG